MQKGTLWKNSAAVVCSIYCKGFNFRLHKPQRKQKSSEYNTHIEASTTISSQRYISKRFSSKKQLIYYSLIFRNNEFTSYFYCLFDFGVYVTLDWHIVEYFERIRK
jgi:hypothetical protein